MSIGLKKTTVTRSSVKSPFTFELVAENRIFPDEDSAVARRRRKSTGANVSIHNFISHGPTGDLQSRLPGSRSNRGQVAPAIMRAIQNIHRQFVVEV